MGTGIALLGIAAVGGYLSLRHPGAIRPAGNAASDSKSISDAASPAAGKVSTAAGLEHWKLRISAAEPKGFADLMRELMALRDPALRAQVAQLLVKRWVSVDMGGFIAFVDETEVDDDGDADSLWAVLAPALACVLPTLSDEVASRPELNEVVRRLIEYSARKDPEQALAWAKQWLMDDALESALATISGEMIKKSPERALQVLQQIQTSVRRVDAIGAIATVYGTTHPEEATAWAKALAIPAERPYAVNAVLAARAEVEPEASAKEFSDFREKMAAAYRVEREAEIAKIGLSDIKERREGEPLTPEEAMDSETLPGREDPQIGLLDDAAGAIAKSWAATDPAKAMQWAESIPAGRLRDDVIESALTGWASRQPAAAYAYYMKNHAADSTPAEPIFDAWAQAEPLQAAEQAGRLTDPALREKAIGGVVSGWLEGAADQQALAAWVDKLPGQRERDEANSQIAEAASYDQPEAAWQRALTIQDQQSRREALKSAFASLTESDPGHARVMLAETKNLTPDETSRLNRMLNAVTSKSAH